ncbi:MAG: SEC-C metal-binding domain-containing protein, partial [Ruminiclostridium sp.]
MGRNDACFCGSGKKQKNCHADIEESSMAANIFRLYNRIDNKIDEHYSTSQKKHKCEKGCAECCFNQTPIHEIEYNLIQYEILRTWSQQDINELSKRVEFLWESLCKKHPDLVRELETSY